MSVKTNSLVIGMAAVTAMGTVMFMNSNGVHASAVSASALDDQSVSAISALDQAMESVASRVTPAVVNISVTSKAEAGDDEQASGQGLPPGFAQFFGQGGARPQQPQLQHGIGSGVIISPDGYIVTNGHVVEGATQIRVTLHDRRILTGKVVGVDKMTDLAVVKVAANDLPAISWGDSAKLIPGQTVLAFGSPFGYLQFSVTRGIVSAVDRPNPYADDARKPGGYIQTDAAINQGNSGGPLVNAHGEVVGINTFIISNSGAFAGAGFAIPAQIAKATTAQLIKFGKVDHGYLGIGMNDVTPDNAHFFNLSDATGAIVTQVAPGSPAGSAGLKQGDVIRALDGQKIVNSSALQVAVSQKTPGTKLALGVLRDGKESTVNLTVGSYKGDGTQVADASDSDGGPKSGKLGLAVANLTDEQRQQLHVPADVRGALIAEVRPASPAEEAGLQPGDVVLEVNRKPTTSADQFANLVHANPEGKDVLLLVWSRGNASYRTIRTDGDKG